jgi:hypothetical protein
MVSGDMVCSPKLTWKPPLSTTSLISSRVRRRLLACAMRLAVAALVGGALELDTQHRTLGRQVALLLVAEHP